VPIRNKLKPTALALPGAKLLKSLTNIFFYLEDTENIITISNPFVQILKIWSPGRTPEASLKTKTIRTTEVFLP
jgi:hypothetical protein